MLKKITLFYIVAVVAFVLIVSLLNARNDSATYDEIAHIPAGYSYLVERDMRLNPEHPPLIKMLSAIPLLFLDLNFDTTQKYWTEDVNGQWDAGRAFLYASGNDPEAILFWSRVPIILLSIAFGLFLFWWGARWLGIAGGLTAFTLAMFDPNILGHNHFVTTDLGIAFFLALAIFFFLEFLKNPSWKNVGLGGLFFGLTHLAKFSSILLLPIFLIATIVYALVRNKGSSISRLGLLGAYIGKGVVAVTLSWIFVWIAYAFIFPATPPSVVQNQIDFSFPADDFRPGAQEARSALNALTTNAFIRPFGEYALGATMVFKRVAGGNTAYFMGAVDNQAFPLYFPTVFVLKETLPFLLLLLLSAVFSLWKFGRGFFVPSRQNFLKTQYQRLITFLQRDPTLWVISGFVLLYGYLSITGNLNIGFRHLFPMLPFLYLLVAHQAVDAIRSKNQVFARVSSVVILTLLVLHAFATILSYPYYTSYFNELAGGSKNGYQFATDSNADWGQDLERLRRWVQDNPEIDTLRLDYFGGGSPQHSLGDLVTILPWWDSRRPIEPGWYAISVNASQGSIYDTRKSDDESYRWLRDYTPVAQIGTSIFIYFVEE